jgi:ubiquinone/menaquinone biosynthesis C-methylase UbiE
MTSGPVNERYTHGHSEAVVAAHAARTAQSSAAYLLPHLRPGLRLLDVGCGPGSITVDLAQLVAPGEVVGVDRVDDVLSGARALAAAQGVTNVRFEAANVYDLPFAAGSFDVVHAHQTLQHLVDPVAALREMERVLTPGGLAAVRDADYGTMVHSPHEPGIDAWLALYHAVTAANRADADAGRHLSGWVHAVGLVAVITTTSTWTYADPASCQSWAELWAARLTDGAFADQAQSEGLATRAELDEQAVAFRHWARQPAAFFAFLHGEVLARRADG